MATPSYPLDNYEQPVEGTEPQPQAEMPQAPPPPEFFLEAPSGTKYRTLQDAIAGVTEKDRMIEDQRRKLEAIQASFTPQQAKPQTVIEAFEAAVKENRGELADQAIDQRVEQRLQAILGPLAPIIGHAALNRAVETASRDTSWGDPNIPSFVQSGAFQNALKTVPPVFAAAVKNAMDNPTAFPPDTLPQLIASVYRLSMASTQPTAPRTSPPTTTTPPRTQTLGTGMTDKAARDHRMGLDLEEVFGVEKRGW